MSSSPLKQRGTLGLRVSWVINEPPKADIVECLGASIDRDAQVSLVRKLLSELARDPGSGKFKDLQQQTDDQQLQPMQKPFLGGGSTSWGCGVAGGSGTNP